MSCPAFVTVVATALILQVTPVLDAQARRTGADPRAIIERAVQSMGGEQALRGITTTTTEFNNVTFALGQEETPESPARATLASGRIVVDWKGDRRVQVQEVRPVAAAMIRQRQVIAGDIGMNENDGRPAAAAPAQIVGTKRGMRLQPERILLAALDNPSSVTALRPREWGGALMDGARFAHGPDTVSLYFDRISGLLTVGESVTDDPVLGDRRNVAWYTRWQAAGSGVKLPRQIDSEANGRLQSHSVITSATVNGAVDEALFAIPDTIASRAQRASTARTPLAVQLVELAPNVWRAEGSTHHSLVVEQPERLVVIEAPQSPARSRAVLDTLRSRFPGKPVATLVNTHHHWDHSGGVRAYMAAGIPVVTHVRNAAFIRGLAAARRTVDPDALSRRPRIPAIRTVTDSMVLGAGDSRVVIYTIPTIHAEGVLAAYVPGSRILFASDVLSPAATLVPAGSAEMVAMARSRGLTVDRFAGGHGTVASWGDIERAAGGARP
ncbi:MAG: MBL fold metallo-hydrolase [Gemmatimonadaceae bacterium]|nr:MBL fold metallo-hydrolase [Gemmatimonadaceae bacterium]